MRIFSLLQKPDWVNAEMKFTLSADSLPHWDCAIYEDDQEKLSEVPENIKKLASQGKVNSTTTTSITTLFEPRELSLDFNMNYGLDLIKGLLKLDFLFVVDLQLSLLIMT